MNKFVNRQEELLFLNEKWAEQGPQLLVLYGKRRVGKTELVKKFIADKPHIYFLADQTTHHDQLRTIAERMGVFFNDQFVRERGFASWKQVFQYLAGQDRRIALVIDEFPYLIGANRAIPSIFQKEWDEIMRHNDHAFVILLGSSIAMMEASTLFPKAPLYGRRTGDWHVEPLRFMDLRAFFPGTSFEDRLSIYAVAGGIPQYLLEFQGREFWQTIRERILSKGQPLYREVEFLLREELKEPRGYFSLLRAIALGKRKLGEMVNDTGMDKGIISKYIHTLNGLRITKREIPVTERLPEKSRRGIYIIQDPFFRFWFRFVFPYRSQLEEGNLTDVEAIIKREWEYYQGGAYEEIMRAAIRRWAAEGRFPFTPFAIGRWWSDSAEIDVLAFNEDRSAVLFGEVKWSRKPLGVNIYEELAQKARQVIFEKNRAPKQVYYLICSRSGFTDQMKEFTHKKKDVFLVEGEQLK